MSRIAAVAPAGTIQVDVESAAHALAADDFAGVAGAAERATVTAGRLGDATLVRAAAALLTAAERNDASSVVASLVRLADALDRRVVRRRAA